MHLTRSHVRKVFDILLSSILFHLQASLQLSVRMVNLRLKVLVRVPARTLLFLPEKFDLLRSNQALPSFIVLPRNHIDLVHVCQAFL